MTQRLTSKQRYDAVIVGGRCAGAATAAALAERGASVLVLERSRYGADTVSTHALMRGGVLSLHRLGALERIVAAGTPAVRSATFLYPSGGVTVPIRSVPGSDALYAPRRTLLDRVVVDVAREAGAEVRHGMLVQGLVRDSDGRVSGVVVHDRQGRTQAVVADVVIGADGRSSRVADWVRAPTLLEGEHHGAVIFGYWSGLEVDGYLWGYAPGVGVGAIPTNDGLTCVFVSGPPEVVMSGASVETSYVELLRSAAPELAARLVDARPSGKLLRFSGARGHIRAPYGPGWALVGDAGVFRDPITAHGITDALRDAELLAEAIARGDLEGYARLRAEFTTEVFHISDEIASFAWTLERVQQLHKNFSQAMTPEVRWLSAARPLTRMRPRPPGPRPPHHRRVAQAAAVEPAPKAL
ncbi:MAG: NAD(P)/FAD-dependent oxidoreductase [Polyangiaceae bacterium]|nr:NAD(P)/FAD-dependent oxidoreductase [Polyangiaceae bacterium]